MAIRHGGIKICWVWPTVQETNKNLNFSLKKQLLRLINIEAGRPAGLPLIPCERWVGLNIDSMATVKMKGHQWTWDVFWR